MKRLCLSMWLCLHRQSASHPYDILEGIFLQETTRKLLLAHTACFSQAHGNLGSLNVSITFQCSIFPTYFLLPHTFIRIYILLLFPVNTCLLNLHSVFCQVLQASKIQREADFKVIIVSLGRYTMLTTTTTTTTNNNINSPMQS